MHLNGSEPTQQDVKIECWIDADFSADKADRKSVSGYVLTMTDLLFYGRSKSSQECHSALWRRSSYSPLKQERAIARNEAASVHADAYVNE